MRRQGEGSRDKGRGTRDKGQECLEALVREVMPAVGEDGEPGRDLWPQMRARLNEQSGVASGLRAVPWFDWALGGGVVLMAAALPAGIPVLLYYL